jgi:hypothetical protein
MWREDEDDRSTRASSPFVFRRAKARRMRFDDDTVAFCQHLVEHQVDLWKAMDFINLKLSEVRAGHDVR